MKTCKAIWLIAASLILPSQLLAAQSGAVAARTVQLQLPEVSAPTPVTAESRPFLGARDLMESVGYVEEEYFISGNANVYDWEGPDHHLKVIAGPGKYVTRILVRRPRDPATFSGNIEVTILNASLRVDIGGPSDFGQMVKQGDVWIGITSKPLSAMALKHFDPVRYASLDWNNPAPPESRCSLPTIIPPYMMTDKGVLWARSLMWLMSKTDMSISFPETEDGLVWDMLGQLGLLSEKRTAQQDPARLQQALGLHDRHFPILDLYSHLGHVIPRPLSNPRWGACLRRLPRDRRPVVSPHQPMFCGFSI